MLKGIVDYNQSSAKRDEILVKLYSRYKIASLDKIIANEAKASECIYKTNVWVAQVLARASDRIKFVDAYSNYKYFDLWLIEILITLFIKKTKQYEAFIHDRYCFN